MVERHWRLSRDPFSGGGSSFVPTPVHAEALERLVHTIEAGERLAILHGAGGLGKSVVLAHALERAKGPDRRIARVVSPIDGPGLLGGLAEGLGRRVPPGAGRPLAWRLLADAVRLCRWQDQGVVLAVDEFGHLADPADRLDLDRLVHLDPHPRARLTVVLAGRTEPAREPWGLAIRLLPLTRDETEDYLTAKLAAAGRAEPAFTPRAITRLHALAAGVPRGLDRLASLALMAGALRKLEIIPPDVIAGVASECVATPWD